MSCLGKSFLLVLMVCLLFSCLEGGAIKAQDLKPGDTIGECTVGKTVNAENFQIVFRDEKIIEGNLIFGSHPARAGVKKALFQEKLNIKGDLIDLSKKDEIYFTNSEDLEVYLKQDYLVKSEGKKALAEKYQGKLPLKIVVRDLSINYDGNSFQILAEMASVLELDNQKSPKVQDTGLKAAKAEYEKKLATLEEKEKAAYTEKLKEIGYQVQKSGDNYKLGLPGEKMPKPEEKGEEGSMIIDLGKLKVGQKIEGLEVTKYKYEPKGSFHIILSGTFQTKAKVFMMDMFGMAITPLDGEKLQTRFKSGSLTKGLMQFCGIRNIKNFESAIGSARLNQIKNGQPYEGAMVLKNYEIKGHYASEFFASVEFVSLAK